MPDAAHPLDLLAKLSFVIPHLDAHKLIAARNWSPVALGLVDVEFQRRQPPAPIRIAAVAHANEAFTVVLDNGGAGSPAPALSCAFPV